MSELNIQLLNDPVDVSKEFRKMENMHFNAMKIQNFDEKSAEGTIFYRRHSRKVRMAFNQLVVPFEETNAWEFPNHYGENQICPFSVSFVTPRTLRIRFSGRKEMNKVEPSLMLDGEPSVDLSWTVEKHENSTVYESEYGSLTIVHDPFRLELRDSAGKLLTRTHHYNDIKSINFSANIPFSFVRRAEDTKRFIAATFSLMAEERIFGCGESFTAMNKRGQKVVLDTYDCHGGMTPYMYKPVPFFMSNRGYGMFVHTSALTTFDFGQSFAEYNTLYIGDDSLDLFVFLGNPKEVLTEYTALTGRSPVPPLWSFGLWMSKMSYRSEEEVREVAWQMREKRIPCDVINIDVGWFDKAWQCDYKFSQSRFEDPRKMIEDLKSRGIRICLWQLPYFTPENVLYQKAVEAGYVVRNPDGSLPTEDAVIDFSNPEAVTWYQGLLAGLLEVGVGTIKVDFGEAAPKHGIYASGKSGLYEHNLYPLRYNKAVADITKEITGESIIWARSAWAGSQRYPLHWGGDIESTDNGMLATLRAGLSIGLCGFTYWSHDIGGFVKETNPDLYKRWLVLGMLTSHSRCHASAPREPWNFGEEFVQEFRHIVELKYKLMPYVYAQAVNSSTQGFPMMRTLFFEYPEDRVAWMVEDEYMFGNDLLVAPLFEDNTKIRDVYMPEGIWIDYQTNEVYEGGKFHSIAVGDIPAVLLVKDGAILPHAELAQTTEKIKWDEIDLRVYHVKANKASGMICLPGQKQVQVLNYDYENGDFVPQISTQPLKVKYKLQKINHIL